MKLLSIFARPKSIEQRLFETLHPRPDLRDRRFANWSMERRQRYLDAVFGTPQSLRNRGKA
jgi:hypothetical protein